MKIGIVGVGRVGASIAAYLLFHPKVNEIYIHDINKKRCLGEFEDLKQSANLLGKNTKIKVIDKFSRFQECKYVFITAGHPRKHSGESMYDIYNKNFPIIDDILKKLPNVKNIYLVTNPWDILSCIFKVKPVGYMLDEMRTRTHSKTGAWILDMKGYTNWGIAAEAYRVIK